MTTEEKVKDLIDTLGQEIVDETVDLAKDAVWDNGQYSGPGERLSMYHKGYVIAVLRWYTKVRKSPVNWENPPEVRTLR